MCRDWIQLRHRGSRIGSRNIAHELPSHRPPVEATSRTATPSQQPVTNTFTPRSAPRSMVYVSRDVRGFFLSYSTMLNLGILSPAFPTPDCALTPPSSNISSIRATPDELKCPSQGGGSCREEVPEITSRSPVRPRTTRRWRNGWSKSSAYRHSTNFLIIPSPPCWARHWRFTSTITPSPTATTKRTQFQFTGKRKCTKICCEKTWCHRTSWVVPSHGDNSEARWYISPHCWSLTPEQTMLLDASLLTLRRVEWVSPCRIAGKRPPPDNVRHCKWTVEIQAWHLGLHVIWWRIQPLVWYHSKNDDTCHYDEDLTEYWWRTIQLLTVAGKSGVIFNKEKFQFAQQEVDFAGFRVSEYRIDPLPKYFSAIRDFPTPTSTTDIRSWFGLVNQVANYAQLRDIMAPFRPFLSEKHPFSWNDKLHPRKLSLMLSTKVLRSLTHVAAQVFERTGQTGNWLFPPTKAL